MMSKEITQKYKCLKHKNYRGNKLPTNQCLTCLQYYDILHPVERMPHKPTKQFKDKSKYTRKEKHKGKLWEPK